MKKYYSIVVRMQFKDRLFATLKDLGVEIATLPQNCYLFKVGGIGYAIHCIPLTDEQLVVLKLTIDIAEIYS